MNAEKDKVINLNISSMTHPTRAPPRTPIVTPQRYLSSVFLILKDISISARANPAPIKAPVKDVVPGKGG